VTSTIRKKSQHAQTRVPANWHLSSFTQYCTKG